MAAVASGHNGCGGGGGGGGEGEYEGEVAMRGAPLVAPPLVAPPLVAPLLVAVMRRRVAKVVEVAEVVT